MLKKIKERMPVPSKKLYLMWGLVGNSTTVLR